MSDEIPHLHIGPYSRRVLKGPLPAGNDERKVLLLIAACVDSSHAPSIGELAARTKVQRNRVVWIINRLRDGGWLMVQDGDQNRHQRNGYRPTPERARPPKKKAA